jgi:hypothetical protein
MRFGGDELGGWRGSDFFTNFSPTRTRDLGLGGVYQSGRHKENEPGPEAVAGQGTSGGRGGFCLSFSTLEITTWRTFFLTKVSKVHMSVFPWVRCVRLWGSRGGWGSLGGVWGGGKVFREAMFFGLERTLTPLPFLCVCSTGSCRPGKVLCLLGRAQITPQEPFPQRFFFDGKINLVPRGWGLFLPDLP